MSIAATVGGLSLSWGPELPDELVSLRPDDVVGAWAGDGLPGELQRLAASRTGPAPKEHAYVVGKESTWVVARRADGAWGTWTVRSPRFANALAEVCSGSRLTNVKGSSAADLGSVLARFDTCAACGSPAELERAGRTRIILRCTKCSGERWPTLNELTQWAWATGTVCPRCRSAVVGKKGPSASFLGCSTYPKCNEKVWIDQLLGAPVLPESQRARRPSESTGPKRQRKSTSPPKSAGGVPAAALSDLVTYGVSQEDAERWLRLGFQVFMVTDMLGKGVSIDQVESAIHGGVPPDEYWRRTIGGQL